MIAPSEDPAKRLARAVAVVRCALALLLAVHGYSRALKGDVGGFGDYLADVGFPAGHALAWAITGFEMVGSVLLLAGRLVRPVAAGFIVTLGTGIWLVHRHNGWFVVGGGTGGMEYSVLLIAGMVAMLVAGSPARGAKA